MIDYCPYCNKELNNNICCEERKNNSDMIDTSIFLEAFDEGPVSSYCKLILEGAKNSIYLGHVSTIILGEIMKKLLELKKEANYRYESIYRGIIDYLMFFRILYICEETLEMYPKSIRGEDKSHDKLNLACARHNEMRMFIMKDFNFTDTKSKPTHIAQIVNKNKDEKLRALIKKISDKLSIS